MRRTVLVGAALLLCPTKASAEDVTIWIRSEGSIPVRLVPLSAGKAVACEGACVLRVPRGEYELAVDESESIRAGRTRVGIDEPSTLEVRARSKSGRSVALGFGIAGATLAASSLLALAWMGGGCGGNFSLSDGNGGFCPAPLAIIGGIVGLGTAFVGFGLYFRDDPAVHFSDPPKRGLAPIVTRDTVGFGGFTSF